MSTNNTTHVKCMYKLIPAINIQVIVSTPSKPVPWMTNLSQPESKLGRALAGGHLPSLAKAIVQHKQLSNLVFSLIQIGRAHV